MRELLLARVVSRSGLPGVLRRAGDLPCARSVHLDDEPSRRARPASGELVVRVHAAALFVALLRGGFFDEATEFAEWYLETFDHDLES